MHSGHGDHLVVTVITLLSRLLPLYCNQPVVIVRATTSYCHSNHPVVMAIPVVTVTTLMSGLPCVVTVDTLSSWSPTCCHGDHPPQCSCGTPVVTTLLPPFVIATTLHPGYPHFNTKELVVTVTPGCPCAPENSGCSMIG